MISAVKNLFKTNGNIEGAAFLIAFFSLASQLTGLFRDRIFASTFGPSETLDIYYAAFKIPDAIYAVIAAFISAVTIVPLLSKAIEKENWDKAHKIFSTFLNVFLLVSIPLSLIIFYFLPSLVQLYIPGFSDYAKGEVVTLGRIMLLQPIFLGISSLISTLAQTENKFLAFSMAPIMYNFGIIFGALVFYKDFGIVGLSYGVVLGAILHLTTQSFSLIREWRHGDFVYSPKIVWAEVWGLLRFSYLRASGLFVQQIKTISITFFASLFAVGSLSITTIAINLENIPWTLIAIAYTTAVFPTLSRLYEEKNEIEFQKAFLKVVKYIIFLALPVTAYAIVMRAHLVRIFLGAGSMNWDDTKLLALSFAILMAALSFQSYNYLMTRVCYARHNARIPFFTQTIAIFFMIAFIFVAYRFTNSVYLTHAGFTLEILHILRLDNLVSIASSKVLILPIAIALSTLLEFTLVLFMTRHFNLYKNLVEAETHIRKSIYDSAIAASILFVFVYFALRIFEPFTHIYALGQQTVPGLLMQVFFTSVFGFLVWYAVLKLRKNEEINNMEKMIKEKIWKKKIESNVNLGEMRG